MYLEAVDILRKRAMTDSGVEGRGLFLCLEGIDGAGKTTVALAAGEILRERGFSVASFDKKDCQFGSPYVRRHMTALREVIWNHPADDPYLELSDEHWVHLQAAWYSALAKCRVEPLLAGGHLVLTDTWTFKFLAKLRMRPTVDFERASRAFAHLTRPDLVIRLHVDPRIAAARKRSFSISEAGNHEGPVELSASNFIDYQRQLSAVLEEFGRQQDWASVEVSELAVDEVATVVADVVVGHATERGLVTAGEVLE